MPLKVNICSLTHIVTAYKMSDISKINGLIANYLITSDKREKTGRVKQKNNDRPSSGKGEISLEELILNKISEIHPDTENYHNIALKKLVETMIVSTFGEFSHDNPDTEKVIEKTFKLITSDEEIYSKYISYIEKSVNCRP